MRRAAPPDAELERFLAGLPSRSAGLSLEGPAGIGKSYHLAAALTAARGRGWRVLFAQPVEAEAWLGGCGLVDLLAGVSDDELATLPAPQRHALSTALLRESGDAPAPPPDERAVAVSLTGLVHALAAHDVVVIAVDDVQWMDPSTVGALQYLARRLPDRNVGILTSTRVDPDRPNATGEAVTAWSATRIVVPPLDRLRTEQLIRERLGSAVSPDQLARAVRTSGGNPLFALELANALTADVDPYEPLAIPAAIGDVVGARLRALPRISRDCLAAASALARPSTATLARLGLSGGLAAAERAGMLKVERGAVRFTHPLLAEAAYAELSGSERAVLHRRLADVVDSVEERARHLALGADGPDPDVATALDAAREQALARGDTSAAIDAARLSLRATPSGDPAEGERRLALGLALNRAGDARRARRELKAVAGSSWPAGLRGRALVELATHQLGWGRIAEQQAREALELAELTGDPALLADAHLALARTLHADMRAAEAHARSGLALLETLPETAPGTLSQSLQIAAETAFYLGHGVDHDSWRRAGELDRKQVAPPLISRAAQTYAVVLKYADELERARELMLEGLRLSEEEHDGSALAHLVFHLSELELFAGRLDLATGLNERHRELAAQAGGVAVGMYQVARAYLAEACGELDVAAQLAAGLVADGVAGGSLVAERHGLTVTGRCAALQGRAEDAVAAFERLEQIVSGTESVDPSRLRHIGDYVEALLALNRVKEARAVVERYESRGRATQRRSALGVAARCRGLLLAVDGDADGAFEALHESLTYYDDAEFFPLDRARTLLAEGQLLRRQRRKAAARDMLQQACEEFDRIGARHFAARAATELSRVGLRPSAPQELTATERRVAELVASGMKSKDVAAALFISPATVAANLSRVYRKLNISSRAELGAVLGTVAREPS